jgi:hypothetical protein
MQVVPSTSAPWVREETAQLAEAVETAAQSQTGPDVPAAKDEKPTMSGMSAGAVAAATEVGEKSGP